MVQILGDLPVAKLYELADALKTAIDALSDKIGSSRTRAENIADAQRMIDWQDLLYLVESCIQRKVKLDMSETSAVNITYNGDGDYE